MTFATRSLVMVGAMVALGCASTRLPNGLGNRASISPASFQPVALMTFERPFGVVGAHGRIVGRLRPRESPFRQVSLRPQGGFTYVLDFRIVATKQLMEHQVYAPSRAKGVRVIYFHPGSVRTAFSDPRTFTSTEAVAKEEVTFSIEFLQGFSQIMLRAIAHRTSVHDADYEGATITAPGDGEGSFELYGVFSPAYGGFLLASTE